MGLDMTAPDHIADLPPGAGPFPVLVFAPGHPVGIALSVPYRLVKRAFVTPLDADDPVHPVSPPHDDAVLTLAREAAAR